MSNSLNNLAITATNSAITSAMGAMFNTLQSKIANAGRDRNCKFYYNEGAGGSILQVVAKSVVGGAVSALKDEAVNEFNSWLNGKEDKKVIGETWSKSHHDKGEEEMDKYGQMDVGGGNVIMALDDWGLKCPDALMLGVKIDHDIKVTQEYKTFETTEKTNTKGIFYKESTTSYSTKESSVKHELTTNMLVWYDTTAIVTINSDKNLITTRVQGRDYSRKELVSNGDIKFSVSGQITSKNPDIYPAEEVKKFIKVMQYKGIAKVNNQILDQFGIENIVITSFNLTPQEGYKAVQKYSFSAIGLQPESEIEITEDTILAIQQQEFVNSNQDDDSEWMKMLKGQLDGLKSMAGDLVSQGAGLATGMLENTL